MSPVNGASKGKDDKPQPKLRVSRIHKPANVVYAWRGDANTKNRVMVWPSNNASHTPFEPEPVATKRGAGAPVAIASALASLPFWLHAPIDADRFLPLLLLPAIWMGRRTPQREGKAKWLLVWVGAAAVVSTFPARNPAAALAMAAAVALVLAGADAARRASDKVFAIEIMLGGILLGSIAGFATVLAGWGADSMFFPTYWSARLFGAHAMAGSLAGMGLLLSPGSLSGRLRLLAALGTVAAWTALAWSGSRAPALGLALALALWFWRGGPQARKRLLWLAPLLALLALAMSRPLGTPYPQMGWWPAISRTVDAVESSSAKEFTSERTDYWRASWIEIQRSPWIGNGADAYRFIQPKQPGNQPHNTYVQWLLEYGVLGTIPLLILLGLALRPLATRFTVTNEKAEHYRHFCAAALGGVAGYAIFDGAAYHMVIFIPAAVLAGIALAVPSTHIQETARNQNRWARAVVLASACVLLLHTCLILLLLRGRHVAPDSMPARALRFFPSSTQGITNWTESWRAEAPDQAAEWIKWAQNYSDNAAQLHMHAAQIHLNAKDWAAAEQELVAALPKVLPSERPDLEKLIAGLREFAAKNGKPINASPAP